MLRAIVVLVALLSLAVAGLFWQGQRGAAVAQELSSLQEQVQEASRARSAEIEVDVQVQNIKRTQSDSVRSEVASLRKGIPDEVKQKEVPAGPPDAAGIEWRRMFNESVKRVNTGVESTQ